MRRWPLLALACIAMQASAARSTAQAADMPPGVSSCSGCHSSLPSLKTSIPSLVGRSAPEIAGIMREFKSGARPGTVMGRIAKGFGDADIDAMAEWLAPPIK